MRTGKCETCGRTFQTCREHQGTRFCSFACFGAWRDSQRPSPRPCLFCGTPFRPIAGTEAVGHGKYCSRACAGKARRRAFDEEYHLRSEWYNSLGWAARSREVRAERPTCEECGSTRKLHVHHKRDPFPTRDAVLLLDRGNLKVLCTGCHRHAHSPPTISFCEVCGAPIRHAPSRARRFCSIACRDKHSDFAAMPARACIVCGKHFLTSHENQRACGLACAAKLCGITKRERRPSFRCEVCGREFTVPPSQAARQRVRACSRECWRKLVHPTSPSPTDRSAASACALAACTPPTAR
jgi:hypothetical protein